MPTNSPATRSPRAPRSLLIATSRPSASVSTQTSSPERVGPDSSTNILMRIGQQGVQCPGLVDQVRLQHEQRPGVGRPLQPDLQRAQAPQLHVLRVMHRLDQPCPPLSQLLVEPRQVAGHDHDPPDPDRRKLVDGLLDDRAIAQLEEPLGELLADPAEPGPAAGREDDSRRDLAHSANRLRNTPISRLRSLSLMAPMLAMRKTEW